MKSFGEDCLCLGTSIAYDLKDLLSPMPKPISARAKLIRLAVGRGGRTRVTRLLVAGPINSAKVRWLNHGCHHAIAARMYRCAPPIHALIDSLAAFLLGFEGQSVPAEHHLVVAAAGGGEARNSAPSAPSAP